MIAESYFLSATNTDVLAAGTSRLSSIPYAGRLIIETQASTNDGSNFFALTVQLPDGSTPLESVIIPDGATAGGMNMDDKYTVAFDVPQGGHVTIDLTETGTSTVFIRVTLMP